MRRIHLDEFGDTLVEVLLATAVLSVVMATAFTLTNKATRVAQTADERTQVSNMMQTQAELIKAMHSISSDGFWLELDSGSGPGTTTWPNVNINFCDSKPNPRSTAFQVKIEIVDIVNDLKELEFEKVTVDGVTGEITSDSEDLYNDSGDLYNVWVEAVDTESAGKPIYTDFYVYSCWEGIGDETIQRSGITVRLAR